MTTFLSLILGTGPCAGMIAFCGTACIAGGFCTLMLRIAGARYRSDKVWYATSSSSERIEQHIHAMRYGRRNTKVERLKRQIAETEQRIKYLQKLLNK